MMKRGLDARIKLAWKDQHKRRKMTMQEVLDEQREAEESDSSGDEEGKDPSTDWKDGKFGVFVSYVLKPDKNKPSCTLGRLARWDHKNEPAWTLEKIIAKESHLKSDKYTTAELMTTIEFKNWSKMEQIYAAANKDQRMKDMVVKMGSSFEREARNLLDLHKKFKKTNDHLVDIICKWAFDGEEKLKKKHEKKRAKLEPGTTLPACTRVCSMCNGDYRQIVQRVFKLQGYNCKAVFHDLFRWACKGRIRGNWLCFYGRPGGCKSYATVAAVEKCVGDQCFTRPAQVDGSYLCEPLGLDPQKKVLAVDESTTGLLAKMFGKGIS